MSIKAIRYVIDNILKEKERRVINLLFGLEDGILKKDYECGKILNLSRQAVDQFKQSAIKKFNNVESQIFLCKIHSPLRNAINLLASLKKYLVDVEDVYINKSMFKYSSTYYILTKYNCKKMGEIFKCFDLNRRKFNYNIIVELSFYGLVDIYSTLKICDKILEEKLLNGLSLNYAFYMVYNEKERYKKLKDVFERECKKKLKIEIFNFSPRTYNSLKKHSTSKRFKFIGDIVSIREKELLKIRNLGEKSLKEIKQVLKMLDINFDYLVEEEESISSLKMSNRSYNALIKAGIITKEQLKKCSRIEIANIRGIGEKSYREIISVMDKL